MEDLRESVSEMDEMEQIRIETELEKQHQAGGAPREREQHRDSGVGGDMAGNTSAQAQSRHNAAQADTNLKRSAINNSLLDLSDSHSVLGYTMGGVSTRRGSVGSLGMMTMHQSRTTFLTSRHISDSGMSVSFQSGSAGSAGTVSQESSPQQLGAHQTGHQFPGHHHGQVPHGHHHGQLQARSRKLNTSGHGGHGGQSTQL